MGPTKVILQPSREILLQLSHEDLVLQLNFSLLKPECQGGLKALLLSDSVGSLEVFLFLAIKLTAASRLGAYVASRLARVWFWAARWLRWVGLRAACWFGRVGLRAVIYLRRVGLRAGLFLWRLWLGTAIRLWRVWLGATWEIWQGLVGHHDLIKEFPGLIVRCSDGL